MKVIIFCKSSQASTELLVTTSMHFENRITDKHYYGVLHRYPDPDPQSNDHVWTRFDASSTPLNDAPPLIVHKNSAYQFLFGACMVCKNPTTKRCAYCKLAYYCNQACQQQDFVLHKELCQTTNKNLDNVGDLTFQTRYGRFNKSHRRFQRHQVFADVLLNGTPVQVTLEDAALTKDPSMFRFLLYCNVQPMNLNDCYQCISNRIQFEIIEQYESIKGRDNVLQYDQLLMGYGYNTSSGCDSDNDDHLHDIDKYLQTHEIFNSDTDFYCCAVRPSSIIAAQEPRRKLTLVRFFVERGYVTKLPIEIINSLSGPMSLYGQKSISLPDDDDELLLSWGPIVEQSLAKRKLVLSLELGALFIPPLCKLVLSWLK